MAGNRTVRVMGSAYSETGTVAVECTFGGVVVHRDVIPTNAQPAPDVPGTPHILFSFEMPKRTWNTTRTMSLIVQGGTVFISGLSVNLLSSNTPDLFEMVSSNSPLIKQNIRIDGVLINDIEPMDGWVYRVEDNQVLHIDWYLPAPASGAPGRLGNPSPGFQNHLGDAIVTGSVQAQMPARGGNGNGQSNPV